ncbi:cadmium-translocating p-type atpase [Limosilactobacillus gastricus DSM 16045]|uniref:Cd(2+)-exporting ATPase n=2 Tax=Limosilactobacillus gastricus TaxID=227942 RepID=A0A0R1VJJ7_9LACO|nr:cadmium-translocating p-type atpase [Limosilactobacillus gastricus DSM 16045]
MMKMSRIQKFYLDHQRLVLIVMTTLLAVAYLGKFYFGMMIYQLAMILVALIGVIPLVIRAGESLRYKIISIESLVSLAVIGAFVIGEYNEAGIVVWLFTFGDWLETITLNKTRQSIRELTALAPQTALRINGHQAPEEVDIDEVEPGDQLLVKTGSQIPVDGSVVAGDGHVNEASLTGESVPVHKRVQDSVSAGTILTSGTLTVMTEQVGEDTIFGKLIELVENAQDSQTQTQRLIDRFSQFYTPLVLVLAVLVGLISRDLSLAITVLVLGCPGALVIGVPVSTVAGIGTAAKKGIVVKGGRVLESLRKVDTLVFDKTGTLTVGKPQVETVQNINGDLNNNWRLLASLESESNHPLAHAILEAYPGEDFDPIDHSEIIEGRGIVAQINGQEVLVGNERLMTESGISLAQLSLPAESTHVLMAVNRQLRLGIAVMDVLRPEVASILKEFKEKQHYQLVVLSGDHQAVTESVMRQVPIDLVRGDLLPADKQAVIKQLQDAGHQVAFIGDGINDSPAITQANVGIAMGSGTEAAIEIADVVLVRSTLEQLKMALSYSKRTVRNMRQNITIAILTVVLLLIGLIAGYIYMASGMLVHELSILIVILNGMRLIRY